MTALLLAATTPVLVVLVVVIVLLLGLLGAGTVITVRHRPPRQAPPRPGEAPPVAPVAAPPAAPPGIQEQPGRPAGAGVLAPPRPEVPEVPEAEVPAAETVEAPEAPAGEPVVAPGGPGVRAPEAPPAGAPESPGAPVEAEIHLPEALPEARRPRVRERVGRARDLLAGPFAAIRRRGRLDESAFEALEEALLLADVGLATTERLLGDLRSRVRAGEIDDDGDSLLSALQQDAVALFANEDRSLHVVEDATSVWLFVGVNGVGKTTTIGKLASFEIAAGRSAVLAAGDTFRAAAAEQLELWGERSGAEVVRGAEGADPSSVVFDAVQHAAARGVPLVLADTAGRLHTKVNLMEELAKVRRVADRPPGRVTEVLLVLDATTGQNGLVQARQFTEAASVTGVILTKLDGTAKGGVVLAIRSELGLPIKLVGLGEGAEDLVEFDPQEFVGALFD